MVAGFVTHPFALFGKVGTPIIVFPADCLFLALSFLGRGEILWCLLFQLGLRFRLVISSLVAFLVVLLSIVLLELFKLCSECDNLLLFMCWLLP